MIDKVKHSFKIGVCEYVSVLYLCAFIWERAGIRK